MKKEERIKKIIEGIAKSRFKKVFKVTPTVRRNAKYNISRKDYKDATGVYIIKEDGVIIYVGSSYRIKVNGTYSKPSLYKTIIRHFQSWKKSEIINPSTGRKIPYPRISYRSKVRKHTYSIRVIKCKSKSIAEKLEKALVIKHNPRDNKAKYESYQIPIEFITAYEESPALTDADFEEVPF